MKKTILFLVMALALTTQTLFAQVPSYVPTNGLVGYWPFNGNANDESGNGNNGTNNGATLTTDRNGNGNSAYDFDGTSNYIKLPKITSLNDAASFTFSCWILPEGSTGTRQFVLSRGFDYETGSFFISQESESNSNKVRFSYNGYSNYNILSNQGYSIPYQNWQLLTVTKNGTTVNLYINSILISSSTNTANLFALDEFLYIGSHWYSTQPGSYFPYYFNGKIDDVGIYNRALTQQEITAMYNGVNYSDTCNAVSGSLVTGLVGYWPFCGNANDESGNGNNGVVNGTTLTTDRFGNSNNAYDFDGISNYIEIPNFSQLNSYPMTVSFWLKSNTVNSGAKILNKVCCSSWNGWDIEAGNFDGNITAPNSNFHFEYYSSVCQGIYQSYCSPTPYPIFNVFDNTWRQCVFVVDDSGAKVYWDGVLMFQQNWDGPAIAGNNQLPLNIGRYIYGSNFFKGIIDDIGIWNRALTQQEITTLFNANQCITNITVTDTLIINVGQLSFNDPVTWANNITIAPNPASSQININFNNITNLNGGTLKIINSLGQEVATTPITTSGTNSTMQLATWGGTGMYFVQIINPQGQIVDIKKIILQ